MPPVVRDDTWLWRNKDFSDVTLLVYPAGDGPDGAWTSGKPEPLAKIPLHSVVLASVSPEHYRRHLLRLWQDKEQGTSSATGIELICFPGEPEAVPEAVLHHAYTGILPDEAHLLAWMMWRADYLDMLATVEACLGKLQAMAYANQLTVQDLVVISSLPALQTASGVAQQHVDAMTAQVLETGFKWAVQVLVEEQHLDQFVHLSFPLLKQWAALDSIVIDSENTVAVLFTAWYDHQLNSAPPATAPTEQQCRELSALICLDQLSPSFHLQALPHLSWYRPPPDLPPQHAIVRILSRLDTASREVELLHSDRLGAPKPMINETDFKAALARGGNVSRLVPSVPPIHQWILNADQLAQLWDKGNLELEGGVYYAGYVLTGCLQLTHDHPSRIKPSSAAEQERILGIKFRATWPTDLLNHGVGDEANVPEPVTALQVGYKVGMHAMGGILVYEPGAMLGGGVVSVRGDAWRGWEDVAEVGGYGGVRIRRCEELVTFLSGVGRAVSINYSNMR